MRGIVEVSPTVPTLCLEEAKSLQSDDHVLRSEVSAVQVKPLDFRGYEDNK